MGQSESTVSLGGGRHALSDPPIGNNSAWAHGQDHLAGSNYCIELPAGAGNGKGANAAQGWAPAAAHACVTQILFDVHETMTRRMALQGIIFLPVG